MMVEKTVVFLGGVNGVGLKTIAKQARTQMPYLEILDVEKHLHQRFEDYELTDRFKAAWVMLQLVKCWDPFWLVIWPFSTDDCKRPERFWPQIDQEVFRSFVSRVSFGFVRPILILVEATAEDIYVRCPDIYGLVKRKAQLDEIDRQLLAERQCFNLYCQIVEDEQGCRRGFQIRNDGLLDPTEILPATRDLLKILHQIPSPHPHGGFIVPS